MGGVLVGLPRLAEGRCARIVLPTQQLDDPSSSHRMSTLGSIRMRAPNRWRKFGRGALTLDTGVVSPSHRSLVPGEAEPICSLRGATGCLGDDGEPGTHGDVRRAGAAPRADRRRRGRSPSEQHANPTATSRIMLRTRLGDPGVGPALSGWGSVCGGAGAAPIVEARYVPGRRPPWGASAIG